MSETETALQLEGVSEALETQCLAYSLCINHYCFIVTLGSTYTNHDAPLSPPTF